MDVAQFRHHVAERYLPTPEERRGAAEVSTPVRLVDQMLGAVSADFWKTPRKVLECCCGKGNFVLGIFEMFDKGLAEAYPEARTRHSVIIEQCLYFSDISQSNVDHVTQLLGRVSSNATTQYNSQVGDTLKEVQWKHSFDLGVMNPPYDKGLYKKFVLHLSTLSQYNVVVIPSTFTVGVSHKKFVQWLWDHGLTCVNFLDRAAFENLVDIDTLFYVQREDYRGTVTINGLQVDRGGSIRNITSAVEQALFEKLKRKDPMVLYKGANETLNYKDRHKETDSIHFCQSETHSHKMISRLNGGRGLEVYYLSSPKECAVPGAKVLFPRGTGSYNSQTNLAKMNKPVVYSLVTEECVMLSTGIVYVKASSVQHAEFLQWYLMRSALVRFLFKKNNRFSELTKGFVQTIPMIHEALECNDNAVFSHFALCVDEICHVENQCASLV